MYYYYYYCTFISLQRNKVGAEIRGPQIMTATAVGLTFPLLPPWDRHLLSASPQNYPQRCWRVSPKRFGDFSAIIWSSLMFVWSSGEFDQARDIVSSHSLPAQFYPCSWNTDFIQMLKDKRSSIEKKVFTSLNDTLVDKTKFFKQK